MATAKVTKQPMHERISRSLRAVFRWAPARREAMKRAKTSLGLYICAECKFPNQKIFVDHIVPVRSPPGSKWARDDDTWDGFIARLFVDADGLQCLCSVCHRQKSIRDNLQIRNRRKADQ